MQRRLAYATFLETNSEERSTKSGNHTGTETHQKEKFMGKAIQPLAVKQRFCPTAQCTAARLGQAPNQG